MTFNKLKELTSNELSLEINPDVVTEKFMNFSDEFVKLYKDIEEDEHLFVGAVTYFNTPF